MNKIFPIFIFSFSFAITTDEIYDESWALLIGIDKYKNVRNLNYAVKDAQSMQSILIETFKFPEKNIRLLSNENATYGNIRKELSSITKVAGENDRVLIFFAGHGETFDLPDGGEEGYLIPYEGDTDDLYLTAVPMDELRKIALHSKAKHILYLVDACYGGITAVGSRGLDAKTTPNYIEKIAKDKSRQVITAGGRGEQVIEKAEWGHSAFTKNLKKGLQDGYADVNTDGVITANELGVYLQEKVTIDSENQQTPQFGKMTTQGEGEFIFVTGNAGGANQLTKPNDSTTEEIDYDKLAGKIAELVNKESPNEITTQIIQKIPLKKWRFYFTISPYAIMKYPDGYSDWISNFQDELLAKYLNTHTTIGVNLLGISRNIDFHNSAIGFTYSGVLDRLLFNPDEDFSIYEVSLTSAFLGINYIDYLNINRVGWFYKIESGLSILQYESIGDYNYDGAGNLTYTLLDSGLGLNIGGGYLFDFKTFKILSEVIFHYNGNDLTDEGIMMFDDFSSYNYTTFTFGVLF